MMQDEQAGYGSADSELMRVSEVARLIKASRTKVYCMIAAKQLPHCRLGGMLRIPSGALRRLIAEQTVSAAGSPF